MSSSGLTSFSGAEARGSESAPGFFGRVAALAVLKGLEGLREGCATLALPDGSVRRFGDPAASLKVRIEVVRWRAFRRLLTGGDLAAAESFMDGDWNADDLVGVVRLFVANAATFDRDTPATRLANLATRARHAIRRNTLAGARRNVAAHYDLGNDFYRLFLDDTMTYSCAVFESVGDTLEAAQERKWRRLAEMAHLGPGQRVLEIGCGWGGFAAFAAKAYGCHVTGLTLSTEQEAWARAHAPREGAEGKVYDRIVSIEMLEAVGHEYLGDFFEACDRLLAPDGLAAFQVITVPDVRHDRLLGRPDFIKKHVFPGSHVPSVSAIASALARRTSLFVDRLEEIGPHYAETLRRWRMRFLENRSEAARLGFDERFLRMWEYYLAYCEGGFLERYVNDVQLLLTRSRNGSFGPAPAYGGRT